MSNARPLDRSAAALGLVIVVAANFLYLLGLPSILDPMMSLDPFYIEMAHRPLSSILSEDPAWGPLYAVWFKPFVAAFGDPLVVYAANVYGLSIAASVLIYLYLLLLTRRAVAGVGGALFFLVCDFNVPLSSKISLFAVVVVLAGLTVSELVPAGARRMAVVAVGVLLASYARPEIYPAALCLCLATLWLAHREMGESGWRVLFWPAGAVASILILASSPGTPIFSPYPDSDRLFMAFREHFAWNWAKWHEQWRYYLFVWESEFGGAQTLSQAFLNNPGAVMHHMFDNLLGTVRFMTASAFNHHPLFVPATCPSLVKAESLVVSAAVFGSLLLVASHPGWRRQMFDRYGHALFAYATLATCSLASATVIFPQAGYLVIPGVLLMLSGTLAATLMIPQGQAFAWRKRALAALLCLVAVPRPFVLPSAYAVAGSPFKARIVVARPVTDTIEVVRSLKLPAPVQVLTLTDGIAQMLGAGFHEVKMWQKGAQPLQAYMYDNDIGMIISLEAGRNSFVVDDPYWTLIQNTPELAGFTRLPVPNHEVVGVYVRADLLKRAGDPTPLRSPTP